MAKNDQQAPQEEAKKAETTGETASNKPSFEDDEPVTVIWKSWGTSNMPRDKETYFDHQTFRGGVGRRIPYHVAKKWQQQGHGIYILPVDAQEIDFIRATGHAPMRDQELEALLRATPADKLAAMLGPEGLDKITATHKK